ncbi:MAG: hypothetical protein GTN49_10825 [candidate division Zixibacteria bacterium]|nr:hypothetical protein [candidate division Zixibacteria bacterium]
MARHLGQIAQGGTIATPPATPRVIAEDFYVYGIQFQTFQSGDTATGFIQIEADSDFLIQKLAYFSNLDDTQVTVQTQDVPLATILIVDTGSGRQLMNIPIAIGALFGDGRLPYILPTPKLFTKNSRINVTVFNFGAVNYEDLWINFEGKKIFTSG